MTDARRPSPVRSLLGRAPATVPVEPAQPEATAPPAKPTMEPAPQIDSTQPLRRGFGRAPVATPARPEAQALGEMSNLPGSDPVIASQETDLEDAKAAEEVDQASRLARIRALMKQQRSQPRRQSAVFVPPRGTSLSEESFSHDIENSSQAASFEAGDEALAGLRAFAFGSTSPDVPPGSHYPEWIWDALDRPGYVTLELHVATNSGATPSNYGEIHERPYPVGQAGPVAPPKQDLDHPRHALVSFPNPKAAPWGEASRVLCAPKTWRRAAHVANRKNPQDTRSQEPAWASDPAGISAWLAGSIHHGVIFGACQLGAPGTRVPDDYWVVLPLNAVREAHERVYGPNGDGDPGQTWGREGVAPGESVFENGRRFIDQPLPHERTPVLPTQRVLGQVLSTDMNRALQAAMQGARVLPPKDWPAEDVTYLNAHWDAFTRKSDGHSEIGQDAAPLIPAPRAAQRQTG